MNPLSADIQVAEALAHIKAAMASKTAAIAAAEKAFSESTKSAHGLLRDLQGQYEACAFELACEAQAGPYNRSGCLMRHDECHVEEEGIVLQWFENDGPDIWFTATWQALASAQANEAGADIGDAS